MIKISLTFLKFSDTRILMGHSWTEAKVFRASFLDIIPQKKKPFLIIKPKLGIIIIKKIWKGFKSQLKRLLLWWDSKM
jgi:hypothetical protein